MELIAGIPLLIATGFLALQLLATGYSLTLADGAAEAGALALAAGGDPREAVKEALPGWAAKRVTVKVEGGRVSVVLRPPSASEQIAERLAVGSSAWVREPRDGG